MTMNLPICPSIDFENASSSSSFIPLHNLDFYCSPAFTESANVICRSEAFYATLTRLCGREPTIPRETIKHWQSAIQMDLDVTDQLQRTSSYHSTTSTKSQRSQTIRVKPRKHSSYSHISSSASSITSSDKSLTSFPSFSPISPNDPHKFPPHITGSTVHSSRKPSPSNPSIVESLTTSSQPQSNRTALFDDALVTTRHVPGALHHANDEHIERLIARSGAVALIRQISEDLAQRDTQIASIRRKSEERERALRKIILQCGLSNLDLETKLRAIEAENQTTVDDVGGDPNHGVGIEDLMSDAMSENGPGDLEFIDHDATIRTSEPIKAPTNNTSTNTTRGWKDYIWGTSKKNSQASSINEDTTHGENQSMARNGQATSRKTVLQAELFQALSDTEIIKTTNRASSQSQSAVRDRKPSSNLATLALKFVAGNATGVRDVDSGRGRANSVSTTPADRAVSISSVKTTMSARPAPTKPSRAVPTRRPTGPIPSQPPQERWDTMGASPVNTNGGAENFGPVEMDTILPLEAQPPTLTQAFNNQHDQEFLTDRFGFIYDQRRKKRQREAAEKVKKTKRGSRVEMLSSARNGVSNLGGENSQVDDDRPDTPTSTEERGEDGKPAKRWQDYLKIATIPTELLSHTPSGSMPAFEVMEGGEVPRSPAITAEERGFLPSVSTTTLPSVSITSDNATISGPMMPAPHPIALNNEDTEPVKLLLQQLGEVHDSLQREKTVRWNDFLRKVRAERKRDGEAMAAALAADSKSRPMVIMPEATLADGEMIGVAGLGNKGKVGRAKWNEFKMLVLGGIPVVHRAKIWAECSGAAALRIPGYYEDLVHREGHDDPAIIAQIQMDINPYARRNAEVGYCQGMNLITACLLLVMPTAEDAFWMLTSIIEFILPQGYYGHSLLASRADQQVLRQYVAEILPKLSQHLDDLAIELEALTFQWFLSVFTDCLSAEALFRVWDIVLCTNDGSTFLFQVALALLKLNESQLLQCSTPASIYTYINHQMTNHAISIDGLIHASEGLRKVVKREEVEIRRAKAIEAEKDLVKQREDRNRLRRAERTAAANDSPADYQAAEVGPWPQTRSGSLGNPTRYDLTYGIWSNVRGMVESNFLILASAVDEKLAQFNKQKFQDLNLNLNKKPEDLAQVNKQKFQDLHLPLQRLIIKMEPEKLLQVR
ncbi:hypothetical protein B7494_g5971 [Chlorociboria aeruginascens]|nr:hypothetical protein B7494_g5971 [Chlorociboria aeruginascens]